jgi:chemotaxis protein CheY-P-specific phosphatase CheC
MKVDLQSLETYNDLARDGAEEAAASLAQMTGVDTRVEGTRVTMAPVADVREELRTRGAASVEIGFEGGIEGRTVLAFDEASVDTLTAELFGGMGAEMPESSLKEVGNIMTSGFIDGWADHLGTTIDISTPTYAEHTGTVPLGDVVDDDSLVFVFENAICAVESTITFQIYMLPERGSVSSLLAGQSDAETIPMEKLSAFNDLTAAGAENASENLSQMTGLPAAVEISRLSFVPIAELPESVPAERRTGTVIQIEGLPSGYVAFLFEPDSAHEAVDALVPTELGDEFGDMAQSALQELGNVMTSGFVDGWANVLDTTIDMSTPQLVDDGGRAVMNSIAARLGQGQRFAFVLDATITTDECDFHCNAYVLPEDGALRTAVEQLSEDTDLAEMEPRSFSRLNADG